MSVRSFVSKMEFDTLSGVNAIFAIRVRTSTAATDAVCLSPTNRRVHTSATEIENVYRIIICYERHRCPALCQDYHETPNLVPAQRSLTLTLKAQILLGSSRHVTSRHKTTRSTCQACRARRDERVEPVELVVTSVSSLSSASRRACRASRACRDERVELSSALRRAC